MDGADFKRRLYQILNEDSDSGWLDARTTFDYGYEAAVEFVERTNCLTTTQSITTVADQSAYDINADFLKLYLKNKDNEHYIKYYDGTSYYFKTWRDYEDIVFDNQTTSINIPNHFTIRDNSIPTRLSGTTTSTGTLSGGESSLTDSGADFSDASVGDVVHNTTDGSDGVVIGETSSTALNTALFGGTNNYWTSGDAYVVQPGARFQLVLDPPPDTSGHTVTLYYVQRPAPVYSDYGVYRFPSQYSPAIVKYAYWLYKYRDDEPNFGDAMYKFWDMQVRRYANSINGAIRKNGFKVNLKKRA